MIYSTFLNIKRKIVALLSLALWKSLKEYDRLCAGAPLHAVVRLAHSRGHFRSGGCDNCQSTYSRGGSAISMTRSGKNGTSSPKQRQAGSDGTIVAG
jgi:hypothetical protein